MFCLPKYTENNKPLEGKLTGVVLWILMSRVLTWTLDSTLLASG